MTCETLLAEIEERLASDRLPVKRPTIAELEKILESNSQNVEILPDGSIRLERERTDLETLVKMVRCAMEQIDSSPCWMDEKQTTSAVKHDEGCPRCIVLAELDRLAGGGND